MKQILRKLPLILTVIIILTSAASCGIRKTGEGENKPESSGTPAIQNTQGTSDGRTDPTPPADDAQTASGDIAPQTSAATQPPAPETNPPAPPAPSGNGDSKTQSVSIDSFPAEYNTFLSKTVFVGDSICSGLRVYGILPSDNVMAVGNVGARSIFNYTFNAYGTEYSLTDALSLLRPEYIVCSMGMNDINMGSEDKFCENYDNVLSTIRETLPNAKIYVASITPISSESTFCTNDRIDLFNQTLKAHLAGTEYVYLDVAGIMKNNSNALADENNGGDGIHLSPAAYTAFLRRVCELVVK